MSDIIGRVIRTVVGSLAGGTIGSIEGPEEQQLLDVGAGDKIRVENVSGSTSVKASSGNQAIVRYRKTCWGLSEEAARDILNSLYVSVSKNNGETVIELKAPSGFSLRSASVKFWVELPLGIHVTAHSASGSIELEGLDSGVEETTASGSVKAYNCSGLVRLGSQSGSVLAKGGKGDFRVSSTSGSVNVSDVESSSLDAHCTSGSVRVSTRPAPRSSVNARSVSGSVHVTVPSNCPVNVEAKAVSGSCNVGLPIIVSHKSRNHVSGVTGNTAGTSDTVMIKAEAISGSVFVGEQ